MKETASYFTYSETNEYSLDIPAELAGKIERRGGLRRRTAAKQGKKFNFLFFVRIAALVVLVVAAGVFIWRLSQYSTDIDYTESQSKTISVDSYKVAEAEKRATPSYPEFEGKAVVTGRFDYPQITDSDKLTQFSMTYPDFVCWIYIENTTVNYPVVQGEDNEFYLRRNMDGESNLSGTLFMDYRCDRETFAGHNIFYGHNNQNGTMFGPLKKYMDKSFFDSHPVSYTYTKDSVTLWKIFSAYETDTENYYIRTDFISKDSYGKFLRRLKAASVYDTGVEITEDDDILTLSTCYLYNKVNGRFVIHAVKAGETPLK